MHERHAVLHVVESELAGGVIHVHADARGFGAVERRLHVTAPRGEPSAVPLETPGEAVPRDAAVALRSLAVDALVRQADVSALSSHVHLEIVASQVEALDRQHLLEVLEALGKLWIAVLPRGRVRDLLTLFCQTQELMSRVCVQVQRSDVCGGKYTRTI